MQNCVDTILFGQVCDNCDGGSILRILAIGTEILTAGVVVAATIGLIIVGIMWMTARENVAQVEKAKKRIFEIVIGLAVYGAMFAIVGFILPNAPTSDTVFACREKEAKTTPDYPSRPASTPSPSGPSSDPSSLPDPSNSGKYPFATVKGTPSSGNIKCPRNADYTYSGPSGKSKTPKDELFQSVAHSCPFSAVTYSNDAQDQLCASGGTMHYVADKKWCIINSKIDVFQFQQYISANYIKQDGKTCSTDGKNCKTSAYSNRQERLAGWNVVDWGACHYFSNTFASNLNNGEVVSNDAYAAMFGRNWFDGWNHMTWYGTSATQTTWNGRSFYEYNDNLTGSAATAGTNGPGGPGDMKTILATLRSGQATAIGVRTGKAGGGHYMTAIGYTMNCALEGNTYKNCGESNLIVLNTDTKISTLGSTVYCLGYRNIDKPCPGK